MCPTLREVLHLAYFTGMCVNIDLKEGLLHAADVAHLVVECGMRGRVFYATNGSGRAGSRCDLGRNLRQRVDFWRGIMI